MEMLATIPEYEDSNSLRRYYEAFALEQQEKYTEASRSFASLGEYYKTQGLAFIMLVAALIHQEVEKATKELTEKVWMIVCWMLAW